MAEAKEPVAKPARSRGWRIFSATFKWCRVTVLFLLLAFLVFGLFLNDVGLPEWIERRVQQQFRDHGWELDFSRLRLRWYRGIVAEDLQLQRTNGVGGPRLFVSVAEFRLNWKALQHLDLEANRVVLGGGRLTLPFAETNRPLRTLTFDRIGGELLFRHGDFWELKYLEADLMGTHVRFRGDITNASLIRNWTLPARPRPPGAAPPEVFWNRLLTELTKVRFDGRPELNTVFAGDARDWKSFDARMKFTAHGIDTPWGSGTNISLQGHLLPPPRTNDLVRADFKLTVDEPRTPWGAATNLDFSLVLEPSHSEWFPTNGLALLELRQFESAQGRAKRLLLEMRTAPSSTNSSLNQTRLDATADEIEFSQGRAARARLIGTSVHAVSNLFPAAAEFSLDLGELRSSWLTSQWSQVSARMELPALDSIHVGKQGLSWSEQLRTIPASLLLAANDLAVGSLQLDRAEVKARWLYPYLTAGIDTRLQEGTGRVDGRVQTETGEVGFRTAIRLDPRALTPLLGVKTRPWLETALFQSPPLLESTGRFVLPAPTDGSSISVAQILPTLSMLGRLSAQAGACREVPFSSLEIPFGLTNQSWTVVAAKVDRPEGGLEISGSFDWPTGGYQADIESRFDLMSLRPAFPQPEIQKVFDWFVFQGPPRISATVAGNARDPSRLNATAAVVLTNAAFREQQIELCSADLTYTNRFLSILHPLVVREGERGRADGIGIDLVEPRLYLTNAIGNIAPRAVTKAIGPGVDKDIAPFVFDQPPAARAEGAVRLGKNDGADNMRFEVDGGPFHWERFHLEQVRATLFWRGHTLGITNVQGRWRGAKVKGSAYFDFSPGRPDVCSFQVRVDGADLRKVLRDLQPATSNKVEGEVSGELLITYAALKDFQSWQGYGQAHLTNGLLWEIPLFGAFSPVLNAFFPGLGNSRAKHAGAMFHITNSIIYTDDLEIRATAMRMNYKGSVDFEQRVNGRMEAELLRDLPAFGFLISKVFWPVTKLFEYRITGTLNSPKTEQLYLISKVFILPFQPIKTLKELFNQGLDAGLAPPTNSPVPVRPPQ